MMSANVEAMVREGVNAFKAGRKDEARALLSKAVELDPYHEEGWLWLSGVVTSTEDQRTCLENVLAINPSSTRARSGLDYLRRQAGEETLPPTPPAPPVSPPPAPAVPAASVVDAFASNPTSVEWADYDSDAAVEDWTPAPREPEAYEDWVSGLQLGGTAAPGSAPAMPSSSPFYDTTFADSEAASDSFATGAGTSSSPPPSAPPVPPAVAPLGYRPPPEAPAPAPVPAYLPAREIDAFGLEGDEITLDEDENTALFPDIPREIRATRLPGTHERGPFLLKLAAAALGLLNLAAAFLILWKLAEFA